MVSLLAIFSSALVGISISVQADEDACSTTLKERCSAENSGACPICVTQAWPGLRHNVCESSTLGQRLTSQCLPSKSSIDPPDMVGLFKSTWAASDPLKSTLPPLLEYLPVTETGDSCVNDTCRCGATGRVQMVGSMFGVHTVLAAGEGGFRTKPPFTGTLTVSDIEGIFDEKLGDMTSYSPWMDYNMALWAPAGTLDVYTSMLEEDGFSILRLAWDCGSAGGTCYSAIWHIPKSQVVVEIISNQTSEQSDKWNFVDERRHVFATGRAPSSPYMTPLHDSRAVSNLTELVKFYRDVFHLEAFDISEFSGGTRIATFALPTSEGFGHNATIQYVERPAKGGSLNLEQQSTAWFQEYLRSNAEMYMTEPTSCWPVWGDNHLAMFLMTGSDESTDDAMIDRLEAIGWRQYHPFLGMENVPTVWGHTVVYLLDPSGWQIEYHGGYKNPPNGTDIDVGDFDEYCDTHCIPDVTI